MASRTSPAWLVPGHDGADQAEAQEERDLSEPGELETAVLGRSGDHQAS
ncbi:MAG TPA: hypothetical protein VIX15_04925 [Streptosporangiaceae bacterium]